MPVPVEYNQPAYPYTTGYADLESVVRNIMAGTWDPSKPNAAPSVTQVESWLREATAEIDMELAKRGYTVPLTASSGYVVPTGLTAMNGMHPNVYLILEQVASAYATSRVEGARHASTGQSEDTNAHTWIATYRDFLLLVRTGKANLGYFGVTGPFEPEIDPAKAIQTGSLGAFVATALPSPSGPAPRFSNQTMKGF